jgi:glycosyltransferase involved in cell wall biosynthesis
MSSRSSLGTSPRVSVLIPTYNRAALLCNAIDSVLAQTFKQFEIVVVDDGSTDETRAVLRRYEGLITYVYTDHAGPAHARNVGFASANGEYICLLDSDDLYYPHKLALQVGHLDRFADTVMVYTNFSAFDDAGYRDEFHLRTYHWSAYRDLARSYDELFEETRSLADNPVVMAASRESRASHWLEKSEYRGEIFDTYLHKMIVFTNSMMFRRELLTTVGGQDSYFGHFHDLEFAVRICKVGKVAFIDNPTYWLRYHPGQVSLIKRSDGRLNAVKLQRDLLRVVRRHALRDSSYYDQHRSAVSRLIGRLCRAAAIPLLAYDGDVTRRRRAFPRWARHYLAFAVAHGYPLRTLYVISFLPSLMRRIYFSIEQRFKWRYSRPGNQAPSKPT